MMRAISVEQTEVITAAQMFALRIADSGRQRAVDACRDTRQGEHEGRTRHRRVGQQATDEVSAGKWD